MAESEHGYVLDILVYTGSDTLASANPDYSTLPQPARVVLHLLGDYSEKGHRVFTDRYYTSIPLALTLKEHSTGFTGTSVKNRVGLPDEIQKNFCLRDDEVKAYHADDLLVVVWHAAKKKNPVIMVSTECLVASIDQALMCNLEPPTSQAPCCA